MVLMTCFFSGKEEKIQFKHFTHHVTRNGLSSFLASGSICGSHDSSGLWRGRYRHSVCEHAKEIPDIAAPLVESRNQPVIKGVLGIQGTFWNLLALPSHDTYRLRACWAAEHLPVLCLPTQRGYLAVTPTQWEHHTP